MDELLKHVEKSIILAELGISKLSTDIYYIDGMSSPKVRRLLNSLHERPKTYSLSIGHWKGSTLISSLYNNERTVAKAISIDNFSEFEKPLFTNSINFEESITHNPQIPLSTAPIQQQLEENIGRYLSSVWHIDNKLEIVNEDCFNPELILQLSLDYCQRFNLYFYDGNHEEESQYKALTEYYDLLNNKFVLCVDDWSDGNAEAGTRRAIKDLNLKIIQEYILKSSYNGNPYMWWNGIGLFILEK